MRIFTKILKTIQNNIFTGIWYIQIQHIVSIYKLNIISTHFINIRILYSLRRESLNTTYNI